MSHGGIISIGGRLYKVLDSRGAAMLIQDLETKLKSVISKEIQQLKRKF